MSVCVCVCVCVCARARVRAIEHKGNLDTKSQLSTEIV